MTTTPKLTRKQAAIIGLYTGVTCGPFEDVHELADTLMPGITTLGFIAEGVMDRLQEAIKPQFLAICPDRDDPKT